MHLDLPQRTHPIAYYGLALALCLVVAALPQASTALAMLTPTAAVLLMLLVVTREGWGRAGWASLGLHRLGLRSWPVAVALPVAVMGIAHLVLWSSPAAGLAATEPTKGLVIELLPVLLLTNIVVASLTVSLTEEIGWRGYLLPRLMRLGTRRALLLSGLLHGLWHLPVLLLTDLYHPDGSRWLVVPLFLVVVTSAGVFMGWLRLRSGSVWPAVLAHSSHNAAMSLFPAYTLGSAATVDLVAGEWGIATTLLYACVAGWLLLRGLPSASPHARVPGPRPRTEAATAR